MKDISCCALATSRNDLFIIIVVLIISMNIIVIITEKVSEMVMMKRTSTFCFVKRDSKQSSSLEQIEQDLPKSWHCKILLQAGLRTDKPEFTRKTMILKKFLNNRPFLIFTAKNVATPVPEFSFLSRLQQQLAIFAPGQLPEKMEKSSKTYFEIVSFIYLCVAMSLENGFSQKKDKIYNSS